MSEMQAMEKSIDLMKVALRNTERKDTSESLERRTVTSQSRKMRQKLKRIVSEKKVFLADFSNDKLSDRTMRKRTEKSNSIFDCEIANMCPSNKLSKANLLMPSVKKPSSKSTKGKRVSNQLMGQLSYQGNSIKKMLKDLNSFNADKQVNSSLHGQIINHTNAQSPKRDRRTYAGCLIDKILSTKKRKQSPKPTGQQDRRSRLKKLASSSGYIRSAGQCASKS
jgi:hypothetical protein